MNALAFAAALLLVAPAAGAARPPWAGGGNAGLRIAYNVLLDSVKDDYEIFVMDLDGSNRRNISNREGVDWVYHASGDRIYFVSDRDTARRMYFLYSMDADGKDVRKLCPFRLEDSWLSARKGGAEIVVSGRKDGMRFTLYIIDSSGAVVRQLTSDTTQFFNDPAFSPDGGEIVFRHRPKKRDRTMFDELWIMRDDGSGMRQLTRYPAADTTADWGEYHAGAPVWEPNRNLISYMSKRNGNYSIFAINPDGTGERQLTPDGFNEGWHAWSPDGTMIVYDGSPPDQREFDIYVMNADGTGVRKFTSLHRIEQAPVFVRAPAPGR